MIKRESDIRKQLIRELVRNRVFWSYRKPDPELISDDIIIEKTLVNLEIRDIEKLFNVFPKKKIRNIWHDKILINDLQFHSLNILLAYLYFGIKNPDIYLKRSVKDYYKKLYVS